MKHTLLPLALMAALALPAAASEPVWPDLAQDLYGTRPLLDGTEHIAIDTPYRTTEDARTHVKATLAAPPGRLWGRVEVILDDNPMPVSAVFDFKAPQPRFTFDVTMRINGPTPLHVVGETTDGQLYVADTFVKTSGQGACAAPPGTDPDVALATLGQMRIAITDSAVSRVQDRLAALTARNRQVDLEISHPSHSGMQMDQISLLFIPLRYVETVDIDLDGGGYVEMTGSISLSENPRVSLSVPGRTQAVDVTMTDTDGTVSHAQATLPGY
ncbi:sulfur-oxidizing protein SoxY [Roseovarius tolerans]|uniref:Sulfur-oxidizing protein SoxY n=1 Tax=Roseovarius tolerans TaxID=74031 RepID=A0A1H8BIP3_9RHOB|nr:quinoprotein dehydrogenase-associated SoxYZ-like carrier [Roseovarius tolerans]SEM82349.1 sulfur-oxidizing protein SoxY [Roseovarius tolerans]